MLKKIRKKTDIIKVKNKNLRKSLFQLPKLTQLILSAVVALKIE